MATIAWLGTGLLGTGFIKAALKRGDQVRAWNRTIAKAQPLAALGAHVASSLADAINGVDRVHVCLSDDAAVDSALEQLLAVPGFRGPIVDHTTVTPAGTKARAEKLAARGIGFVACPVFMGPGNAAESTGRMLCGGPKALVEALTPQLAKMTGDLVQLGEDVTRPATLKLVGNSFIIGMAGVLSDAMAIGVAGGFDPKELLPFVSNFPISNMLSMRGNRMIQGDYAASFELTMARKDVRLMQQTAKHPLAVLNGLASRMDTLIEQGHGARDVGALSVDLIPPR